MWHFFYSRGLVYEQNHEVLSTYQCSILASRPSILFYGKLRESIFTTDQ